MREITSHHDGHGLAESIIVVATDQVGPGGAHHYYEFWLGPEHDNEELGYIQFQKGPRNVKGSTPGVVENAVLAVIEDRLASFQAGEFACNENADALMHIRLAMSAIKLRADRRAQRSVLGTYNK